MKAFEPAILGDLALANRFVRSATEEGLATGDGHSSFLLTKLMVQLAQGGVGLIITGHAAVSPEGRANPRQLCLWNEDYLPGLLEMTESVHETGGKMILQISHAGIFARASLNGQAALGPVIRQQSDGTICREMTRFDIQKTVRAFSRAADLSRQAGFDGVQISAAHGHLLSSFLSPHYNRRRDEYGGPVENRARLLLDVVGAIRSAVGCDFPVLVKINANDYLTGGFSVSDMLITAGYLETAGVTAVELSGGTPQSRNWMPARPGKIQPEREGYYKDDATYFKAKIGLPLILGGGFRSLPIAEKFIEENICDFIALSRPLICEPDLIQRWKKGHQEPSRCQSDNQCCLPVLTGKGLYCVTTARERKTAQILP